MNTHSMRLSTRLFLAFGVVIALSVMSSGFALLKLKEIEGELENVVSVNNVKTELINEMMESIHVVSRVVRTIALLDDQAQMAQERTKITAARADYDKARSELEKFPASAAGKALRAELDAASAKARPLNTAVMELGLQNKQAEATQLVLKEAGPAVAAWLQALGEEAALQKSDSLKGFEDSKAAYTAARNLLIGTSVISALIAVGLALLVVRSVVKQLGGEPAEVAGLARTIADSDLSSSIAVRDGDTDSVVAGMARMQAALSHIVQTVRGNAESVATASAQIAQGNQDLSQRTEEQASALQQTAATMEQLGTTVRHNADSARQADQLAQGASGVAAKGGDVVGQVVETMKGINDSSRKIADIITVIDGIAFQTNILALNAAVEAARAGEQGRGFAVVASEVRTLAQRSAAAAKEIKTLITDSVEQVEKGSALVDQAGLTMQEIVGSIKRVSDIVAEIRAASSEQSTGVGQVGEAVSQMDQVTQQNAALVEESAAAAASLQQQAEQLVHTVSVFKLVQSAAPAVTAARPGPAALVERRSPNRAINVTRPKFGAKTPLASLPVQAAVSTAPKSPQKTGTDDWESF